MRQNAAQNALIIKIKKNRRQLQDKTQSEKFRIFDQFLKHMAGIKLIKQILSRTVNYNKLAEQASYIQPENTAE